VTNLEPTSSPTTSASRSRRRVEILLLLIPLALHLFLRWRALDGWYERVDVEELNFGLLPAHLLQGLAIDLLDYQTMWREGGSLIVAPFAALFFAALSPSYFALKLAAIAWHGLILLVWTLVARVAFGRREALAFGILLACAPPFAARMQLVALVGHSEGNLFSGLALLGLLLMLRKSTINTRRLGAVLLGTSVTLGGTFAYSVLPASGLCLLLALQNRRRCSGLWTWVLVSMGLGSLLWITYFIGRVDLGQVWQEAGGSGVLALFLELSPDTEIYSKVHLTTRITELVQHHLFWMWGWTAADGSFRSSTNILLGTAVFAGSFAGFLGYGGQHFLRRLGTIESSCAAALRPLIVGFAALYILGYLSLALLSGLSYGPDTYDGYRYLAPLFPSFLLLTAAGLGLASRSTRRPAQVSAGVALAGLAIAFVVGGPGLGGAPGPSPLHDLKGYNVHAVTTIYESGMSEEERRALLDEPGHDLWALSVAEGRRATIAAGGDLPLSELLRCPDLPIPCRLYVEGVGKGWVASELSAPDAKESLTGLMQALRGLPADTKAAGFRGMGRGISLNPPSPWWTEEAIPLLETLLETEEERNWLHEGIGLDEPLHRDFHYNRLFGGGKVPQHLSYSRGLGMAFARLLLDPKTARSPMPLPNEVLEPVAAHPEGVAAFNEGYEAERLRLLRPSE